MFLVCHDGPLALASAASENLLLAGDPRIFSAPLFSHSAVLKASHHRGGWVPLSI